MAELAAINVDRNKSEYVLKVFSGVSGLRDDIRKTFDGIAALRPRITGDTADKDSFASLVGDGKAFPTTDDAKKFWDATEKMNEVLNSTASMVADWCAQNGI
jgi:hypothetical protein